MPDLWPFGVLIAFSDSRYGWRGAGVVTAAANANTVITLLTGLTNPRPLASGGWWSRGNISDPFCSSPDQSNTDEASRVGFYGNRAAWLSRVSYARDSSTPTISSYDLWLLFSQSV
jgi:hypothetical protein